MDRPGSTYWRGGHEASCVHQGSDHLAYPGIEGENEAIGRFALQGSEEEFQETIKEGQNYFGTVDLRHKLEADISEDGTGKKVQS